MKKPCIRSFEFLRHSWQSLFRAARRRHDRFLVYNISSFNFAGGGWSKLLLKASMQKA
ncbi:MAG TPA: hypothetical protein VKD91_10425 [Pyrinomonadaceae bacterium]|nr:hypothetical protein [Pyrinomonadaceae bacterium]